MDPEEKQRRKELALKQQEFVDKLTALFLTDPFATAHQKEYAKEDGKLAEYLYETWVKHGSVLQGVIVGLETDLDK